MLPLLTSGMTLYHAQRYTDALRSLCQARKLEPTNATVLDWCAASLLRLSRPHEALAILHMALMLEPTSSLCYFRAANAHVQLGQYQMAVDAYDTALRIDRFDVTTHYARACVLVRMNNYEAALASYSNALAISPSFTEAIAERGNVLRLMNRHKEAIEEYTIALEVAPSERLYYARGNTYARINLHHDAIRDLTEGMVATTLMRPRSSLSHSLTLACTRVVAIERHSPEPRTSNAAMLLASGYSARANSYAALGMFDEALSDLDQALEAHAGSAFARIYRARVRRRMQVVRRTNHLADQHAIETDLDAALALLRTAMARQRVVDAPLYYFRALAHRSQQRLEDAIADFSACLQLDPTYVHGLVERGLTHLEAGRVHEAQRDFDSACRLVPQRTSGRAVGGSTLARQHTHTRAPRLWRRAASD